MEWDSSQWENVVVSVMGEHCHLVVGPYARLKTHVYCIFEIKENKPNRGKM